jgi:3-(3-hydroxy-phenyl)propionate hydroxylase
VTAVVQASVDLGRMMCMLEPESAAARDRRVLEDGGPLVDGGAFSLPPLTPGPLVLEGGGELFVQPEAEPGDVRLDDLVGQRFLVLGRSPAALGPAASWWADRVGAVVATVDDLPGSRTLAGWLDRRDAAVAVVRPDRYVLAAGDDLAEAARRTEGLLIGG